MRVRVTDTEGVTVDSFSDALYCKVEGGELLGFFSGDPKNEDQYGSYSCHAFGGEAVLIIRTKEKGEITVYVHGKDIADEQLVISAV